MPAQKQKKTAGNFFWYFWVPVNLKPKNQGSQLYWFFQIIWKTITKSQNKLQENDFKTWPTVNFPKKHQNLGSLETNQIYKVQTWIFLSHALLYMNSLSVI